MKMPQAEKLCGFVEEKQTMVNVADTQTIHLKLGSEEFSCLREPSSGSAAVWIWKKV